MIDTAGHDHPFIDYCPYCEMNTAGNHQFNCPCYQPLARKETYPKFVRRSQREIDEHPEWGIKYL